MAKKATARKAAKRAKKAKTAKRPKRPKRAAAPRKSKSTSTRKKAKAPAKSRSRSSKSRSCSSKSRSRSSKSRSRTKAKAKRSPSAAKRAPAKSKAGQKRPAKSRLSKADLREFREMLLDKRRALLGDMDGIEAEAFRVNRHEGTGDLSSMPTHPADLGTDNYEQEFTLGLLESERQMLSEIDEALSRIDHGTYGICQGTGKPITKARLRARPWARYGIEYARMVERGLVHPGDEDEDGSGGSRR